MPKVLLKKRHFKQELNYSCVPTAARILLNYLGLEVESEACLRRILKTKITGTNIFNLAFLKDEKDWNVEVWSELGTLRELETYLTQDEIPIIVLVDTEPLEYWKESAAHVLVVVGFDQKDFIVNDPYFTDKEIKIPREIFNQAWGVFQNLMVVIKKR